MPTQSPVRIGARGSKLSRAQAGQIQRRIAAALGASEGEVDEACPMVIITTTGDRIQDRRLLQVGGKGLFTKEIEEALLDGRVDVAIHSMKDVPIRQPDGLCIAAIPEREDPRDAFISLEWASLDELPKGALLGTASLRRQAQSLHRRPDLRIDFLRGNVDTRLAKLERGEADAILLAAAGLKRLGLGERVKSLIDPMQAPPAPGQGALAVQTRAGDVGLAWLEALRDPTSLVEVSAERGALEALDGSCKTALGAHARFDGARLILAVEALTADGRERFREEREVDLAAGPRAAEAARELGLSLGEAVKRAAGGKLVLG